MRSVHSISKVKRSVPVLADDITEFHAARLLLLFHVCGTKGQIDGLTKMAKLDFFVRYPSFFSLICQRLNEQALSRIDYVESEMVRYHYGPWDHRYYNILGYLRSKGLLKIWKEGNAINFKTTDIGEKLASELEEKIEFQDLVNQMRAVKKVLGNKKGNQLKELIYDEFDSQVAQLRLDEVIR
jgi:hypothetical protein